MMDELLVMILLTVSWVTCDYIGQSVSGEVEAGNYSYFTLRQTGSVEMVLTSVTGDADLYISDSSKPNNFRLMIMMR